MKIQSDNGFFGEYGGQYIAEILRPALKELEAAYNKYSKDKDFIDEYKKVLKNFVGRPTPLLFAENISKKIGGADIYLKLEGLANTGAHKINNAIGQALLAKRMGKTKVIAETGAGQHGVATASACARLGLECEIFMGEVDAARQRPNVFWMEMFGAKVTPVVSGTKTLKDAVNEALREWSKRKDDTFYILGSALGPYPYPDMVRDFQSIIGREVREQMKDYFNQLPDAMIACVGGGSNAMGFFTEFLNDEKVKLIGVEAGGTGDNPGEHAARITCRGGSTGIVQGYKSLFLQDENGQLLPTHSISAGLDYAGIGPQLADLHSKGRIVFTKAMDNEVLEAVKLFAEYEGIIPALESSHALAAAVKTAEEFGRGAKIIVNVSGRGDKDIFIVAKALGGEKWPAFLREELKRIENGE